MNPVFNGFVYVVWFLSTYFVVLLLLILFSCKEELYTTPPKLKGKPRVSVIVPAYNEEEKIAHTIRSLKKVLYKKIEFIIVNDGSKDNTASVVQKEIKGDKRFSFINRTQNKGKAASLNEGIEGAKGTYVACMDADSVVEPRMFEKTLPYFVNPKVGAVTVSVAITKPKRWLHRIIDIEYIIGLSLFLKVFSTFNCVFVTPGPFSMYRKSLVKKIGGFDVTNITEDLEIAYRIHKAGYIIANCLDAKVKTICPTTFKEIYIQRRRWYSGALQTLVQHADVMFNRKIGTFGYFVPANYILIGTGMLVFYLSTYLGISRLVKHLWYFNYTDISIWQRLMQFEFDILAYGKISMIGMSAILLTITLMCIGLYFTKTKYKDKKWGMLGFPFMFFLYQIWWTGAIIAFLRRKSVSWR